MLVFGYISDKIGRKFGMVSALLPIASASLLPLCVDASCLSDRVTEPSCLYTLEVAVCSHLNTHHGDPNTP